MSSVRNNVWLRVETVLTVDISLAVHLIAHSNLALRKKWYYINLKGKTQGKGEKQGPSVENKPFLWVRIEKICPEKKSVQKCVQKCVHFGHFFGHFFQSSQ